MTNRFSRWTALCVLALLVGMTPAFAADLNGKWQGTIQAPDAGAVDITLNFHVEGEKLTGTASSTYGEEQITEGVVKGDDVSFVVLASNGQFKVTYKGKVEGDAVKFNVTIADMGDRELVVKRVK